MHLVKKTASGRIMMFDMTNGYFIFLSAVGHPLKSDKLFGKF